MLLLLMGTAQHEAGDGLVEQLEMRSTEVRYYCHSPPSSFLDAYNICIKITLGKKIFQAALPPNHDS